MIFYYLNFNTRTIFQTFQGNSLQFFLLCFLFQIFPLVEGVTDGAISLASSASVIELNFPSSPLSNAVGVLAPSGPSVLRLSKVLPSTFFFAAEEG